MIGGCLLTTWQIENKGSQSAVQYTIGPTSSFIGIYLQNIIPQFVHLISQIILYVYMSYLSTKYNSGKRWNHAKVYHLNCVKLSSRIMARCLLFWIACSFSNGHAIKHEYSIDANNHCEMWLLLTDIKTKSGTFLAAQHQCANKPTQMETFTAAVA